MGIKVERLPLMRRPLRKPILLRQLPPNQIIYPRIVLPKLQRLLSRAFLLVRLILQMRTV